MNSEEFKKAVMEEFECVSDLSVSKIKVFYEDEYFEAEIELTDCLGNIWGFTVDNDSLGVVGIVCDYDRVEITPEIIYRSLFIDAITELSKLKGVKP